MEYAQFLERIGLDDEVCTLVLERDFTPAELEDAFAVIKEGILPYDASETLASVCRIAYCISGREYEKRGIAESVFVNTFSDISRWVKVYARHHDGEAGLDNVRWMRHHLTLSLFAIGSLQYQIVRSPDDVFSVNLHIPEGTDLSPQSVDSSFVEAMRFFSVTEMNVMCRSWLLSENLSSLLDEKSNIKAFAGRFERLGDDLESRQAEERIFGCVLDDKEAYPQRTSLQKKARDFLIGGGQLPLTEGRLMLQSFGNFSS